MDNIFESWAGASFKTINEQRYRENGKIVRIFDYELSPVTIEEFNIYIWDCITSKFNIESLEVEL